MNVILDFLVMAKRVIISTNAPKKVFVDRMPFALTNLEVSHVTVKMVSSRVIATPVKTSINVYSMFVTKNERVKIGLDHTNAHVTLFTVATVSNVKTSTNAMI